MKKPCISARLFVPRTGVCTNTCLFLLIFWLSWTLELQGAHLTFENIPVSHLGDTPPWCRLKGPIPVHGHNRSRTSHFRLVVQYQPSPQMLFAQPQQNLCR